MFSLTYVSSAVKLLTAGELRELLKVCNRNNRRRNVTGMLLYKDGNFMQVLEGEEADVRAVHEVISEDPRHRGLMVLIQGATPVRQFADWSMGFRNLSADGDALEGYSELLNVPFTGKEFTSNPSASQKLLLSFKQTR